MYARFQNFETSAEARTWRRPREYTRTKFRNLSRISCTYPEYHISPTRWRTTECTDCWKMSRTRVYPRRTSLRKASWTRCIQSTTQSWPFQNDSTFLLYPYSSFGAFLGKQINKQILPSITYCGRRPWKWWGCVRHIPQTTTSVEGR